MGEHKGYKPSNNSEGIAFECKFCSRCKKEQAFREGIAAGDEDRSLACSIISFNHTYGFRQAHHLISPL